MEDRKVKQLTLRGEKEWEGRINERGEWRVNVVDEYGTLKPVEVISQEE
jgi:hypothetical protein